jgi:hypothetical protein
MKIIGIIAILLFSQPVLADEGCLLSGIYKSDAVRTMADYSAHNTISNSEAKRALTEMFGSMTHEWRCTEMRAWSGIYPMVDWTEIAASKMNSGYILVSFKSEKHPDLTLVPEDSCYKIRVAKHNFYEYFCPQVGDGA